MSDTNQEIVAVCPDCAGTTFHVVLNPDTDLDAAELTLNDIYYFECTECRAAIRMNDSRSLIIN